MKSIRRQQATLLISGAFVLYIVCAAVMYRAVHNTLYGEFDANLIGKAASLATLLEEDGEGIELNFSDEVMTEFSAPKDPDYFQVWINDQAFADGWRLLERSRSMGSARFPRQHGSAYGPLVWNLELPDGRPGRAVGVQYAIDVDDLRRGEVDEDDESAEDEDTETEAAIVVVARGREQVRATLGAVLFGLLIAGAILCAAIVPLVTWSVHRSMRPVHRLGRHVGGLGTSELGQPLDASELPVELRPIVTGLNRLLARLDEAFERERRTTANIAHELRTPIAELRSATDVALRWHEDGELTLDAVRTARSVALQMESLVKILLRLSRIESGQLAARNEAVRLRPFVDRQWGVLAAEANGRRLSLDCAVPGDLVVRCDPDALELVVRNLLSNAVGHAPDGDRIEARVDVGDADCTVRIANKNTKLEVTEVARVAEAFWTKDASRANHEHVGLGLAMVSAVGRATGIPVEFALENGRFVVAMRLRLGRLSPRETAGAAEHSPDGASGSFNGTSKGPSHETLQPNRADDPAGERGRHHAGGRG